LGNVWFEKTLEGVFDFLLVSSHFVTQRHFEGAKRLRNPTNRGHLTQRHFEEAQRLRNPTNVGTSPNVILKEHRD
jgi:hypothetical protein